LSCGAGGQKADGGMGVVCFDGAKELSYVF
jgi:hypothetical protein